jgi:hypothetical protein
MLDKSLNIGNPRQIAAAEAFAKRVGGATIVGWGYRRRGSVGATPLLVAYHDAAGRRKTKTID